MITNKDGESNFMLGRDGRMMQHYGPRNTRPPVSHMQELNLWLETVVHAQNPTPIQLLQATIVYEQGTAGQSRQQVNGQFIWDGTQRIIELMPTANPSTFSHEVGHLFLTLLSDEQIATLGRLAHFGDELKTRELLTKYRYEPGTLSQSEIDIIRQSAEFVADKFNEYLAQGKQPLAPLRDLFSSYKRFLMSVLGTYNSMPNSQPISAELTQFFV